jgi:hypothetical protein
VGLAAAAAVGGFTLLHVSCAVLILRISKREDRPGTRLVVRLRPWRLDIDYPTGTTEERDPEDR